MVNLKMKVYLWRVTHLSSNMELKYYHWIISVVA